MKIHASLLVPGLLGLLIVCPVRSQVVEMVLVEKSSEWLQFSVAEPVLARLNPGPNFGGPFGFGVNVTGQNLQLLGPPNVTLPPGSLYPSQNPARHNGGVLGFSAVDGEWRYGVDANGYGAATEAARDASFSFGTYGLSVLAETFTLNFPATAFGPNTPKLTLTGGSWSGGKYLIDVTQPLTITTNAFVNFGQNLDGLMYLEIENVGAPQIVFRSESPGAPNFLSVTIPANTLVAGRDYRAGASFMALTDKRGSLATRLDAALHARSTSIVIAAIAPLQPGAQATLHGVGDLEGGSNFSEVRDATKTGGAIHAVGDTNGYGLATGGDTAFVWSTTDGLRPLPDIVTNFSGTNFSSTQAIALTPDGAFIASRARATASAQSRHAVRVTSGSLTNLDLGTLAGFTNSQAHAISSNGAVLYGIGNYTNLASVPVRTRAVRFTAGSSTPTVIPFLSAGDDTSAPADRGVSADGSVMVGRSTNGTVDASAASPGGNGIGLGNRAFRYVHGSGVTAIPLLPGGTWSGAVAVSPDGNLTLVRGDSASAPQGELYLHNAATGQLTSYGTPNGSRRAGGIVGMTADGAVVATSFNARDNPTNRTVIRNAHGWHDFQTMVERAGVDLSGWNLRTETLFGLSPDGTLVWGRGVHDGKREGFVVEFAPGFLASYREPEVYSAPEPRIVGAWSFDDFATSAIGSGVITFFSNGYFVIAETALPEDAPFGVSGFERGQYTWNAATGAITFITLLDTGGDYGTSSSDGVNGITMSVTGDQALLTFPGEGGFALTRVASSTNLLIGAWGEATESDNSVKMVFLPNGYYFMAQDGNSTAAGDPSGRDGIEWGTYSWNPATGAFTATPLVDTNGEWGFSHPIGAQTITISGDRLTLIGNAGEYALSRVGPAPADVALGQLAQDYDGSPKNVAVTTDPAGVAVSVTYNGSAAAPTTLGTYGVVATVTDPNYYGGATGTLVISDNTPPVITSLTVSSPTLWPANHKMVALTLAATTSDAVGVVSVAIVSVTSSEPDDGLGDGDTANDIVITGAMSLNLRAERSGSGNGRTYTITVRAVDAAGNAATRTVLVTVPKSQGGK